MEVTYKEFLQKVVDKLSWVADEVDFMHPYTTRQGKYENGKNHPYAWTCGFYGGIIWNLYKLTGDEKFLKIGKKCSAHLKDALIDFSYLSHDVGFQYLPTSVADFKITGDKDAMVQGRHAADLLAGRFNPAGRYIRAWNENPYIDGGNSKAGYVIIDCMMNIPLLYWATEFIGDPRYGQIARIHAETVMKHFIREDGSSEHIVVFDPATGEVVDKPEGQGYSKGSAWTRGQSWALYGFAMSYHYTRDERHLATSKKVADYIISQLGDYMPIDFRQPKEPAFTDSSAVVIMANGFLELCKYVEGEEKEKYMKTVEKLMDMAYQNCNFEKDEQSVLQNCSEMYHREESRHVSLIYGDFYLLEALMRLTDGTDPLFY